MEALDEGGGRWGQRLISVMGRDLGRRSRTWRREVGEWKCWGAMVGFGFLPACEWKSLRFSADVGWF